jgi:diguanylate cyclase (GGDEF)-like protein
VRLSRTDDLTGLVNRRGLLEAAGAAVVGGGPVALLLVDVDGFKGVNDAFGHPAGDAVLVAVAARARVLLGQGVVVGRLGGDEFAVLVGQDDPVVVLDHAHVLRSGLRPAVDVGAGEVRITVSVGAAVHVGGPGVEDLVRRADEALYAAKRGTGIALADDAAAVSAAGDGGPAPGPAQRRPPSPGWRRARGRRWR